MEKNKLKIEILNLNLEKIRKPMHIQKVIKFGCGHKLKSIGKIKKKESIDKKLRRLEMYLKKYAELNKNNQYCLTLFQRDNNDINIVNTNLLCSKNIEKVRLNLIDDLTNNLNENFKFKIKSF